MLMAAHEMKCVAMGPFWVLSLREDSEKEDQDEVPRKTGYWILGGYQWWAVMVGSSGGLWWAVMVGSGGLLTDTNDAAGGRLPIGRRVQCRLYQRRAG